MANTGINIAVQLYGDGTSTVFAIDLESDPYVVVDPINWFSRDHRTARPTGVVNAIATGNDNSGGIADVIGATLSGTVLTITLHEPPETGAFNQLTATLLFGS